MAETTKIQWTDHTANPWVGCTKVSPGCAYCYAEVETFTRVARGKGRELWGMSADRHVRIASLARDALAWDRKAAAERRQAKVFCASLADVFEDRPDLDDPFCQLLGLIRATPNLTWQLLTKRPQAVRSRLLAAMRFYGDQRSLSNLGAATAQAWLDGTPPANIWLGASAEDQLRLDERLPHLVSLPARVRFLSLEPLLGPVVVPVSRLLHWVIVGGESGPHARPCRLEWIDSLVKQCAGGNVACFVKQLGAVPRCWPRPEGLPADTRWVKGQSDQLRLIDRKGGDMDEWPEGLRVRQFPGDLA